MAPAVRRAVAALAVLLGACSNHPDKIVSGATSTTSSAGDTSSPGAGPTDTNGHSATTRRASTGSTIRGDDGGPVPAVIADGASGQPGEFAGALLAPSAATTLVLDVRVQAGVSAAGDVVTRIAQLLREQSAKTVVVHGPTALVDSNQTHTAGEIRELADTQGEANADDVAVVHLLYFAGRFSQDGVLGVTVRGDTIAVFPSEIDSATSPLVSHARIERAVVTHELGHVLGLVDLFLDDKRDDPTHPGHSTNTRSVMYWAVESDLVAQLLGGPPPVDFDSDDLADLRAIHGGAARAT